MAHDAPLSDLHAMLAKIGRERHAKRINRIANDPSVLPMVQGIHAAPLDFSEAVGDARNVLLMSQHGGIMFMQLSPGIYECHTLVLPEGRGKWALDMARAAIHWMFTRTDAMELVTKCPRGNLGARALARAIGGKPAFMTPDQWPLNGRVVPCQIYNLTIQDWLVTAPGLEERGAWVERRLKWAGLAVTRIPDPAARRHVGLAFEMFLSGQVHKALLLHSRWAALSGHGLGHVLSERPVSIVFPGATVVIQETGNFYLAGADREIAALH